MDRLINWVLSFGSRFNLQSLKFQSTETTLSKLVGRFSLTYSTILKYKGSVVQTSSFTINRDSEIRLHHDVSIDMPKYRNINMSVLYSPSLNKRIFIITHIDRKQPWFKILRLTTKFHLLLVLYSLNLLLMIFYLFTKSRSQKVIFHPVTVTDLLVYLQCSRMNWVIQ